MRKDTKNKIRRSLKKLILLLISIQNISTQDDEISMQIGGNLTDYVQLDDIVYGEFSDNIRYGEFKTHIIYVYTLPGVTQSYRLVKIPQQKQFLSISISDQFIRHWNANFAPANKFSPPIKIYEHRIFPTDKTFICLSALSDTDTTKTYLWATGYYSRFFLKYDWILRTANFYEFSHSIENFALNKNFAIVLSTDGSKIYKFDLSTKTITAEYNRIHLLDTGPNYVTYYAHSTTSLIFIFRTSGSKIPVYDLTTNQEILVRYFQIPNSNSNGIYHVPGLNIFMTNNLRIIYLVNMSTGDITNIDKGNFSQTVYKFDYYIRPSDSKKYFTTSNSSGFFVAYSQDKFLSGKTCVDLNSCNSLGANCLANWPSGQCKTCAPSYILSLDYQSCVLGTCLDGFYISAGSCQPCYPGCSVCSGPDQQSCWLCFPVAESSTCPIQCPSGKFYNDALKTCQNCSIGCATCISSENYQCTSCLQNGRFLLAGVCHTVCPEGFVQNQAT